MNDLRTVAQQVIEEWRTDYGSVRMASLMMKLEDSIQSEIKDDKESRLLPWKELAMNSTLASE